MKKNIGQIDQILRIVVGVAIIGAGIFYKNWLGVVGVIPLATALLGWCPLYLPLGLSTRK